MAIGNVELMQECFPKHFRMGTTNMKQDKETEGEGKKRRVLIEISAVGTKKRNPDGLTVARANHPSLRACYSPKQWMKYLINQTYTDNLSTAPWEN